MHNLDLLSQQDQSGGGFSFVDQQTMSGAIRVNQLIFSGEYIVGLQAAKTYLKLSQNQLEKTELNVKEMVNSTYFGILSLQNNLDIIANNKELLGKNLEESRAMLAQGLMEETDVLQFEYNFNMVSNQFNLIDRQLKITQDLLKVILGIDKDASLTLSSKLEDLIGQSTNQAMHDSTAFMLENNIDYKMLQTQVDANTLSFKREKSTYLPSLSANYQFYQYLIDPSIAMMPQHSIGVSASIPIFSSGMRNAKVQQAKIELEKSNNMLEMQSQNITILALQAQYELKSAYEAYNKEKKNLELAQKIFDNTQKKYTQGVSSSMDLTQANSQFLMATSAYTTAIVNLLDAKTKLDKINNNL
ncbi:MAG: TolC family protein [Bacteroidales bacterium]|nr:TolC family protein [Bacteroidales bacterium]